VAAAVAAVLGVLAVKAVRRYTVAGGGKYSIELCCRVVKRLIVRRSDPLQSGGQLLVERVARLREVAVKLALKRVELGTSGDEHRV